MTQKRKSKPNRPPLLPPILAALLVAVAFPPLGLWPLALVGIVLLLRPLLKDGALNPSQAFLHLGIYTFTVNLLGFYWISYTLKEFGGLPWLASMPVTLLLFVAFGLLPGIFGWLWARYSSQLSFAARPWALAALYGIFDGFDPRLFPWSPVMSVGSDPWLLASVHALGTWGWRVLFFGLAAYLARLSLSGVSKGQKWARGLAATLIVSLVGYGLGYRERTQLEALYKDRQPVALIQGNVGNYEKKLTKLGVMPTIKNVLAIHRELIERAVRAESRYVSVGIEPWYLWPETSYPGFPTDHNDDRRLMENWAQTSGGLQFVGAYETAPFMLAGQPVQRDYNIVALFHETRGFVSRYQKIIRVPFGEYVPGEQYYPSVYKALPAVNQFGKGTKPEALAHPDPQGPVFVPLVCYEILFENFVSSFVEQTRAEYPGRPLVLVNPTNDSWYGPTSEPWLHAHLARWAAARQGLPLLRPTNTGLSLVIAPWGEMLASGPRDEATVVYGELPVIRQQHRP